MPESAGLHEIVLKVDHLDCESIMGACAEWWCLWEAGKKVLEVVE